ncbi:hypothetical protein NDU88_004850 [Pleurodeles waltl]|uniref:Uncharacterized protein n=1 Tax=Pleurodeles waltl TaxID=8319 RepID=A0AAV7L238_PLEWA|nr:hypothetical protein NDU88_004850 [Pleurodeles waltl]
MAEGRGRTGARRREECRGPLSLIVTPGSDYRPPHAKAMHFAAGIRAVIIRERASFFLSFRHSVSQRPSSAVEDARSSASHSFQRTRSIPHILWAGIPCQLILASRLYFRPGLLAI